MRHSNGFWKHIGSMIDPMDKKISLPFFKLDFGKAEYLLSAPATWFGIPVFAMGWAPLVVASTVNKRSFPKYLILPATGIGYIWWLALCHESKQPTCKKFEGIVRAYRPFGNIGKQYPKLSYFSISHLSLLLIRWLGTEDGTSAASFYICSYHTTQAVIKLLQILSRRRRPYFSFRSELTSVKRELPQIQEMLRKSRYESFPSADAASGAVFATILFLAGNRSGAVAAILSGFGRMYYHAHHCLDVVVGQIIGVLITLKIAQQFGVSFFSHWKVGVFQFIFQYIWIEIHKLNKPVSS